MNAVCVYVSTARLVFQTDPTDANTFSEQRLDDLCQLFSQLRQLLSCAVCTRLLNDPYAPLNDARCQHNVCRLCVRGRKCLRPLCSSCKDLQDFKTYAENRQMRCLLLCYKSLCEHLLGSSFFVQLSGQKQMMAGGNDHMSTQEIVLEGARYEDILNCFSADLPHAVTPRLQLPPASSMMPTAATQAIPLSVSAATPLAPQAVPHMRAHMQNAPKAATPPSSAANATTTYVMTTPTPATVTIKQEHTSASLPAASAAHAAPVFAVTTTTTTAVASSKANAPTPLQSQVQSVYMKHLKHNVETTSSHSFTAAGLSGLPATPTITYVGHNTPGIVVPLVSSSATTTAPLSIASAKLQSYNRQLAQARNSLGMQPSVVKTNALSTDVHAPLTFKVASAAYSAATTATSTTGTSSGSGSTHTTATVTSQQIRNPPSIKTVSNGSAMYSVLYTGVGNKITIKRKTDGDEDSSQRKNAGAPTSTLPTSATPTFHQQVPATTAAATAAKLNPKRRGCRCGNATPTPGKLTCCGQRCPCYVESKSCIGCKCRGCRNPHRPDGGKVRPVIPELACYEIQMADESASLSPSELPVATTATMRSSSPAQQSTTTASAYSADPQPSSVVSQLNLTPTASTTSGAATLIPFINLQQVAQHQHQQQPLESLQRESVLIQNAEGKYQVVNVFTTGSHSQHPAGLQRIHSISQLSTNVTAASSSNSNQHNSGNTGHVTTVNMLSGPTAAPITTTATSTNTLPQMLLQQQHHQRQHQQQQLQKQQTQLHHLQRIASGSNTSTTTSISLQLQQQQHHQRQLQQHQQQMKVHNIMAMRAPSSSNTQTQTMPLLASSGTTSTTITLSPIIVTSPNTFTPDMFSDSESEEFLNHTHMLPMSSAPTRIVAVPPAQASPLSLSSGSGNSSSGSGSTTGGGDMSITMGGAHMAPAMVEVIEASDV